MHSGCDCAEVSERGDDADRAVAAHPEEADVVEKNHARRASGDARRAQQRADEHVGAARLVHDRAAEAVVIFPEGFESRGHRAIAEFRPAAGDDARGLSARV